MITYLDGARIDLRRAQTAADDTRWVWTCEIGDSGQPLMQQLDGPRILPLDEVYGQHGPLQPDPQPVTAAMCQQVLAGEAA